MQTVNRSMNKADLRKTCWIQRERISDSRRSAAKKAAFHVLIPALDSHKMILSFASFGKELDLWKINQTLANEKRLSLPYVHKDQFFAYRIANFSQLKPNIWNILEPDPSLCEQLPVEEISAILVPGLAFGSNKHRLGYGKGYYDRFLKTVSSSTPTWGVGFMEQGFQVDLPVEGHDVPLSGYYLF